MLEYGEGHFSPQICLQQNMKQTQKMFILENLIFLCTMSTIDKSFVQLTYALFRNLEVIESFLYDKKASLIFFFKKKRERC